MGTPLDEAGIVATTGRPRLLVVLPSLGGGGAERATVDLLRGLQPAYHIKVALFQCTGALLAQLPEEIECVDLHGRAQNDPWLVWRLARLVRREQPDAIFSVLRYANLVAILARTLAVRPVKLVINEQNVPSAEFKLFGGGRAKSLALLALYPHADLVTVIASGIGDELVREYRVPAARLRIIPNPVDLERVRALSQVPLEHPWFPSPVPVLVAIGRLHPQKGLLTLLEALALVRAARPCRLVILGEGPQRGELERQVQRLGLGDHVLLPGFQGNPYNYLRHADVFVLSSLYEGFGNVLVEALALGVPIVATDCPVGPGEILQHERTGLLVPVRDPAALAHGIQRVLDDEGLRSRLVRNGPVRAGDYALDRVVGQYDAALREVLGCAS